MGMGGGENRRVRAGGSSSQGSLSSHPPCSKRKKGKSVLFGSLFSWARFSGQSSSGSKCYCVVSPDTTSVTLGSFGHQGTCFLYGVRASAVPTVNLSNEVGIAGCLLHSAGLGFLGHAS